MAKLVLKQNEQSPWNDAGSCVFAYFDGTPSKKDLKAAGAGEDELEPPERVDNAVSTRAKLERWFLRQSG